MQDGPQVKEYLANSRIEWKHQTPQSPWMGRHFERMVRIIKVCLSTAISGKLFNYEEFVTVIQEVENIINSRPLTYQGTDTIDIPLSPSQLVWGQDLTLMPPLLQSDRYDEINFEAKAVRQQYELISQALNRFKK